MARSVPKQRLKTYMIEEEGAIIPIVSSLGYKLSHKVSFGGGFHANKY
jgi:hypothetical protein